jgi:catalase
MRVDGNSGPEPNYFPNSYETTPQPDPSKTISKFAVSGDVAHHAFTHPNSDFEHPGNFYRNFLNETERTDLVENLIGHLGGARKDIQERMVAIFRKFDADYGRRIAEGLGLVRTAKL